MYLNYCLTGVVSGFLLAHTAKNKKKKNLYNEDWKNCEVIICTLQDLIKQYESIDAQQIALHKVLKTKGFPKMLCTRLYGKPNNSRNQYPSK